MNGSLAKCPRALWALLSLVACLLFSGCDTGGANPQTNATLTAPPQDLLRAGEHIKIIYLDIPDAPATPTEQQIPENGKLLLPKGVEVMFANRLKTEVEREIQDIYVNQRHLYPRMTVNIERQGLAVSVGGEVRTPGMVAHLGQMTVTRAINAVGGFNEFADKTDVIVTRAITKEQISVNVKRAFDKPALDLPVYPGDSILVKRKLL